MNIQEEYEKLKMLCKRKQCKKKQCIIDNNLSEKILEYLDKSNSLTETANKFDCSPEELYYCISDLDGCFDRMYKLKDFNKYYYKIEGRMFELDKINKSDKIDNIKMRTPKQDELDIIFTEYKSGKLSLYELADKSNLLIINLFRLLKEHGLIEKESDAIGYNEFYKEYIGDYRYNKYNKYNKYDIDTNLKLFDMYYKYQI